MTHALPQAIDGPSLDELIDASQRARARAGSVIARSGSLGRRASCLADESLARRTASRTHITYAVVEGVFEARPVRAVVGRDGTVAGDGLLLERARLVVALSDTFDNGRLHAMPVLRPAGRRAVIASPPARRRPR